MAGKKYTGARAHVDRETPGLHVSATVPGRA